MCVIHYLLSSSTEILLKTSLFLGNIVKIGRLVYYISCFNLFVMVSDSFEQAVRIFMYLLM